jgi:hypothetical protein
MVLTGAVGVAAEAPPVRTDLTLAELSTGKTALELSGLARWRGKLVGISDGGEEHFLYEVVIKGNKLSLSRLLDLSKLTGYASYQKHLKELTQFEEGSRRIDLEGIQVCGDDVYLINERVREVVRIVGGKTFELLPIKFDAVTELMTGGPNAGFEGLAADCNGGHMYVAKERDPRRMIVVSMANWQVVDQFDVPSSDRAGQQVINIWTGQGLMKIGPDFAALDFEGGYLYALERGTYEIAKIDPKKKTVVARTSYYKHEKGLYETHEPFGVAEALLMDGKSIFVGIDNNQSPFTHRAAKEHGATGVGETLMRLYRPEGF